MSRMHNVIRGVMRDPVVKNLDMFDPHNQAYFSRIYLKDRMRNALRYIGIEDYGLTKAFWTFHLIYLMYTAPMRYQQSTTAYNWQNLYHNYKTNPDVHFSKLYNVQSNDKLYGLRALPKRPWEAFKNPEEVMKNKATKHSDKNIII